MDTSRKPFIVAFYSDAPRAGKSTSAKVIERLARSEGNPVDILSFAFPIRRAARQVLPTSWDEEKVRAHLSGPLKDTPIGELGGRTGRDLLKIIGNTVRSRVRDDLWADRLLEEVDNLGKGGVAIIDDLRWPGEYHKLGERGAFIVRLVTARRALSGFADLPGEEVDGLLSHARFDAEVPAKGLVTQEMLEKLIADLWRDQISARVKSHGG